MRLIDAESIPWEVEGVGEIPVITEEEINAMPTVDAVPVIRCKDCVWRDGSVCRNNDTMPWSDDDFCSNAERKEE